VATIPRNACGPAFGFLDPHGGGSDLKRVASRSAIIVACSDPLGRIFVLETWAGRAPTPQVMAHMERLIDKYAVKVMGVEADGLAGLWTDAMRVNAQLRMRRLPIQAVKQPRTQEKIFRIRTTLQPLVQRGMLFVRQDQLDLYNELVSFPMNERMDLVDALASLVRHIIPPVKARREVEMREDATLDYLRKTGASPRQIEILARERHGFRPRTA
jgi:predicted phage terminase large subunit-like protein